ncbi:MAG: TonB-dependent receptor, partial [Pedobacter sp.]
MRITFTLIFLLIITSNTSLRAQTSVSVQGYVTDNHSKPLPGVTVTLKGSGAPSTATNADGFYTISVPTGKVQLQFNLIGFKQFIKNVDVVNGTNTVPSIQLDESNSELQQVEITGRKEKTYKTTGSFIGKIENQLKDIPQSVSYASKELIADQGLMRVGEVVKNFSGVNQFSFYDDLTIRGFRVNGQTNTQLLNGLRTSTGFWKQSLANYLERVEVLKGPSSALFGNASPGGVVNRVTKKPLDETRRSISMSLGSFNTFRGLADFTGPATKDSTLLYRVNVGYENADSFRDLMFDRNLVVAPSLTFIPSDKT